MKSTYSFLSLLLLFNLMILVGCQNSESNNATALNEAKNKLRQASTIHYDYQSKWDTRLNETTFDSPPIQITYSKVDSSLLGYGFYAKGGEVELVFDGLNYFEIDHNEKTILFNDSERIKGDARYFESSMLFGVNPLNLLKVDSIESSSKSMINNQKFEIFQTRKIVEKEDRKIQTDNYYFIESETHLLQQIQDVIIINGDTGQIIDHYFTNYVIENSLFDFTKLDHSKTTTYQALWENDREAAGLVKQIKVGTQLETQTYQDIENHAISIFGNSKKQSLIMFSFIGCGGCEIAMRDFKKKDYQVNQNIDLLYSSPSDKQAVLKRYLNKKGFPFKGFSKESNMNEDFSAFSFPTFVLVDSKGEVQEVIQGYEDKVKEILFE